MANNRYKDAGALFRMAQQWYMSHPGEQIPLDVWSHEAEKAHRQFSANNVSSAESLAMTPASEWRVKAGQWEADTTYPSMIPILAAISLGFPPESLSEVVVHHGIDRHHLEACRVCENYDFTGSYEYPEDAERPVLTGWIMTTQVINAMCLEQAARSRLIDDLVKPNASANLKLACLLADLPEAWPSTQMELHLRAQGPDVFELEFENSLMIDADTFDDIEHDFNELSSEQLFNILDRSGNLVAGAISEKGFLNDFFTHLFKAFASRKYSEMKCIARQLNSVECPTRLSQLNARIIEAVSDSDHDLFDGEIYLYNIVKALDPVKYADVLEDVVMKINLQPMPQMHHPRRSDEGVAYDIFYNDPARLLSRLADQLLKTEPMNFKRPHFRALKEILSFSRAEQDTRGIDLTGLVCRSLEALEFYRADCHFNFQGRRVEHFKEDAADQIGDFLRFAVAQNHKYDYLRLAALSSNSKRLLASNGFDFKNLPGISPKDRGWLLSDQLGL